MISRWKIIFTKSFNQQFSKIKNAPKKSHLKGKLQKILNSKNELEKLEKILFYIFYKNDNVYIPIEYSN